MSNTGSPAMSDQNILIYSSNVSGTAHIPTRQKDSQLNIEEEDQSYHSAQEDELPYHDITYQSQGQLESSELAQTPGFPPCLDRQDMPLDTSQASHQNRSQSQTPIGHSTNVEHHQQNDVSSDIGQFPAQAGNTVVTPMSPFPSNSEARSRTMMDGSSLGGLHPQSSSHLNGVPFGSQSQLVDIETIDGRLQHLVRQENSHGTLDEQRQENSGHNIDLEAVNLQNSTRSNMNIFSGSGNAPLWNFGGLGQNTADSQDWSTIANGGSFMSKHQPIRKSRHDGPASQTHAPMSRNNVLSFSQGGLEGSMTRNHQYSPAQQLSHPQHIHLTNPLWSFSEGRKRSVSPSSIQNGRSKRQYVASPLGDGFFSASSRRDIDETPSYTITKQEQEINALKKELAAHGTAHRYGPIAVEKIYQQHENMNTMISPVHGGIHSSNHSIFHAPFNPCTCLYGDISPTCLSSTGHSRSRSPAAGGAFKEPFCQLHR